MTRMVPVFLLMLLVSHVAGASDGSVTAGQLRTYCAGQYDVDAGFCAGYVTAVADLMKQNALGGYTSCNLSPVGSQQLMELIQIQMQENQIDPSQPATTLSAETLARFYPCR